MCVCVCVCVCGGSHNLNSKDRDVNKFSKPKSGADDVRSGRAGGGEVTQHLLSGDINKIFKAQLWSRCCVTGGAGGSCSIFCWGGGGVGTTTDQPSLQVMVVKISCNTGVCT